ncbi:MAG: hypothetical protein ACK5RG_06250 [Cyclobacteriaceae bacterium]|jgi:hypothetical protein|nr:hypothetical protein [Flammeovirgaceae bacterium]
MEFKSEENIFYENKDMMRNRGIFSDCPIGWGGLVRQLFKDIRAACKKHNSPLPIVLQIKSKFGRLCFYLEREWIIGESPVAIEVNSLIRDAEDKSMTICEITGLPGSYYIKDGWYATLNKNKAHDLGYMKVENISPR